MNNPFAALVDENEEKQTPQKSAPNPMAHKLAIGITQETQRLEAIFGFSLNETRAADQQLVYLADQVNVFNSTDLNVEILEHALADRLFLTEPTSFIPKGSKKSTESISEHTVDTQVLHYLFHCFKLNQQLNNNDDVVRSLILRNIMTALIAPDLYEGQDLFVQLYDIIKDDLPAGEEFFQVIYKTFLEQEGFEQMKEPLSHFLKVLHVQVANMTIMSISPITFEIIKMAASYEDLAILLLDYSTPKGNLGFEYSNTLLGALFTISLLPKTSAGSYEYFQSLDPTSFASTENILFMNTANVITNIHSIFLTLLKSGQRARAAVLLWFGNCLKHNVNRGKLWSQHTPDPAVLRDNVSDGFMLNMNAVLLKFCMPFCEPQHLAKILKVDPTYCAVPEAEAREKGIHLDNLAQETCLIPCDDNTEVRLTSNSYSFITECFYMAHKSFELGYMAVSDKLVRLNQDVARMERTFNDAASQNPNSPLVEQLKGRMQTEMGRYMSFKASLSEPVLLEMLFHFISATTYWFNQVIVNDFGNGQTEYIPLVQRNIEFPLRDVIPQTLKCIPEFLVENIVTFMVVLRRFNPRVFEMHGYPQMKSLLTFILIYMGSSRRVKNPHLRARLAEALESLLPFHKDEPASMNSLGGYQREMLFSQHEHRLEIVRNLLEVFVAIEMTGQSVEFEQKFNYRRPMYIVMDYLWKMEEHQQVFNTLAVEAEQNMEAVTPPLFLRFINLLMNDAVFLLDESLSNMSKLKEMETARQSGAWDRLPAMERAHNMGYLQHIGIIARFDNILGKDTIKTIERLTSRIQIVFTHYTMVDRVAAMLNYFLLNLVGPNQKNFKVKDSKEYSFDPAGTVLDICKIYVNLKEDNDFCLAISQDGRSYKPALFGLAQDVLVRIGGGSLIGEVQELAAKVARIAEEHQVTEDAVADAPDHFLDPIMSTLMRDPVTLPSSKQTVDRSTIARHLLSDQTDPFNRSPLTMDQVVPNEELADEIRAWIAEKKASKA